jgi:hypothetical protein
VAEIVLDLRRRLGGKFSVDELTAYYLDHGTDWCYEIAYRTAPNTPEAWDLPVVAGAAFFRYVRRAADYGGGQRRRDDEDSTQELRRLTDPAGLPGPEGPRLPLR